MSPLLLCLFIPPSHLPRSLQASCLVEVAGSGLQFVTAIQLRLIVIAADGLEPSPSLGQGRPKHFSLFLLSSSGLHILSSALLILISSSVGCLFAELSLSLFALFQKALFRVSMLKCAASVFSFIHWRFLGKSSLVWVQKRVTKICF